MKIKQNLIIILGISIAIILFLMACGTGKEKGTRVINAQGHTLTSGFNHHSRLHEIRGGPNYNPKLRWDGIASSKEALQLPKEQAAHIPRRKWIKVVDLWDIDHFSTKATIEVKIL